MYFTAHLRKTLYLRRPRRYSTYIAFRYKRVQVQASSANEAYERLRSHWPNWEIQSFWLDWPQPHTSFSKTQKGRQRRAERRFVRSQDTFNLEGAPA